MAGQISGDITIEYLEGLARIAGHLEDILGGSALNDKEITCLAFACGYMRSASHHITKLKRDYERFQSKGIHDSKNIGRPFIGAQSSA